MTTIKLILGTAFVAITWLSSLWCILTFRKRSKDYIETYGDNGMSGITGMGTLIFVSLSAILFIAIATEMS